MAQVVQIGAPAAKPDHSAPVRRTPVFWLQGITIVWMLAEFGVSAYTAISARSPAMFAFSSDSLVELLSATVVLLQWVPGVSISERRATRTAAVLLFVLSFWVAATAVASLALGLRPDVCLSGVAVTLAALIAMPVLAWLKRREAKRSGNRALAADAAQSAACAYLALIALVGIGVNALFHIAWFDAAAALVAVPLLIREGRAAWRGQTCGCC
jgi:divalent metal cation (Fe/Co/Zn/Cd) transporter